MKNNNNIATKIESNSRDYEIPVVVNRTMRNISSQNTNSRRPRRRQNYEQKIMNDPLIMKA